jgi:hypothetical protein
VHGRLIQCRRPERFERTGGALGLQSLAPFGLCGVALRRCLMLFPKVGFQRSPQSLQARQQSFRVNHG